MNELEMSVLTHDQIAAATIDITERVTQRIADELINHGYLTRTRGRWTTGRPSRPWLRGFDQWAILTQHHDHPRLAATDGGSHSRAAQAAS